MKFERSMTLLTLVVLGLGLAGLAAAARGPRLDRRERHIERRIHQGLGSEALTGGEALRLNRGLCLLRGRESRFPADGTLSVPERRQLNRHSRHRSREVFRLKHNRHHAF